MLVINRNQTETFHVGDDIRITVLRVHGKKARIGIEAPADVAIVRDELLDDADHRKRKVA